MSERNPNEPKERHPLPGYLEVPLRGYEVLCVSVPMTVGLMLAENFVARYLGIEDVPTQYTLIPAMIISYPLADAIVNRKRN